MKKDVLIILIIAVFVFFPEYLFAGENLAQHPLLSFEAPSETGKSFLIAAGSVFLAKKIHEKMDNKNCLE